MKRPARTAATVAVAALLALTACSGGGSGTSAGSGSTGLVGIIVKNDTNPFFQRLLSGAQQEAKALGVPLQPYAGKGDGDSASQIAAIDDLIRRKAYGFLITVSDNAKLLPSLKKARDAGLFVVALDSPTDPADAVDATFATDNLTAGKLIGQWARSRVNPAKARIAMLDLVDTHPPVDVARDQGFLQGFGIDVRNPAVIGDEKDPRIVGNALSEGSEDGGKAAMTQLLAKSHDINLVYTINEPAAKGAYAVLKDAGLASKVTIVSVDGGCGAGIGGITGGTIGATAMQFPLNMARLGVMAVVDYKLTGDRPPVSPGQTFFDTGVQLVTDHPVGGQYSKDSAWGKTHCWG